MAKRTMEDLVQSGLERAVELMALAANDAWHFGGKQMLKMVSLDEDEMEEMANYALSLGDMSPLAARDGRFALELMKEPWAVLVFGAGRKSTFNYNCGACGFRTCAELNKAETVESLTSNGPACIFETLNLNMAANAAAAAAGRLGLHCRVFSTLAFAAKALEYINADIVVGVAVSAAGKDPFFDRHKFWTKEEWERVFNREFPTFNRGFIGAVEE
ncbi:MAG: hypothetical protein GXO69_02385 [Acidobacteria bacterium]|nr:hypothetical protein [Acidobacteriota bacterium]